jgi:hypothetical protein
MKFIVFPDGTMIPAGLVQISVSTNVITATYQNSYNATTTAPNVYTYTAPSGPNASVLMATIQTFLGTSETLLVLPLAVPSNPGGLTFTSCSPNSISSGNPNVAFSCVGTGFSQGGADAQIWCTVVGNFSMGPGNVNYVSDTSISVAGAVGGLTPGGPFDVQLAWTSGTLSGTVLTCPTALTIS